MSRLLSLEYVAGIIDGEGWIGFAKSNKDGISMKIALEVGMTHEVLIRLLQAQFRGSVNKRTDPRGNRKDSYTWRTVSNDAANILTLVKPFLIVKQEQATLALGFHAFGKGNVGAINELLKTKMHALNQRGK